MKNFKSKIYKNEKKIKRLKWLKEYYGFGYCFSLIGFGTLAVLGAIGIFLNWPFSVMYGAISTSIVICTGIFSLFDFNFKIIDKQIDEKIVNLQTEIDETIKTNQTERIIEKQIKKYRESNYNKQYKSSIENYISEKNKMDKKLKKLNPNLDTEYLGDIEDLGIKF